MRVRYQNNRNEKDSNHDDDYKEPKTNVEVVGNKIYFYADVTPSTILSFNKALAEMDSQHMLTSIMEGEPPKNIWVYVNSDGGEIDSGLSAMDQVRLTKAPVVTVVDGVAASAATLITVAGTRRLIKKNSFMLIHQVSGGLWGKYEQILDEKKNFDKYMTVIREIYSTYTALKREKLDEILKHDLIFNAKECLKFGLVDEIL